MELMGAFAPIDPKYWTPSNALKLSTQENNIACTVAMNRMQFSKNFVCHWYRPSASSTMMYSGCTMDVFLGKVCYEL